MSNLGYLQIQEEHQTSCQIQSVLLPCFRQSFQNDSQIQSITTVTHGQLLQKPQNFQNQSDVGEQNEQGVFVKEAVLQQIYFDDDEILGIQVTPLTIPHIFIRSSPFQSPAPIIQNGETLLCNQKENPKVLHLLWAQIIYNPKFLCLIMDFLDCSDCLSLAQVNPRLESMFYLYKLFRLENSWNFTMHQISKRGGQSLQQILNQSILNQSEHSLDLDRLSSLFLPEENTGEQLGRVDRVMKALTWSGVQYFQGLNSIVVVLVSLFDDETSYWIAILLLQKSEYISNCSVSYQQSFMKIQKQIKEKCVRVYAKINQFDINIEYFTMKWVMGLFASDVDRLTLMCFWDLLLNFGMPALLWFVVSVFKVLEEDIVLAEEEDQLNQMLKAEFKQTLSQAKAQQVIQLTKVLMSHEMYGEGSQQLIKPLEQSPGVTKQPQLLYHTLKNFNKRRVVEQKCLVVKDQQVDQNGKSDVLDQKVLEEDMSFQEMKNQQLRQGTIQQDQSEEYKMQGLFTKLQQKVQENNEPNEEGFGLGDLS